MRYVMLVSYDGTEFCGWQIQPGKRTVQGELERAAAALFGVPVSVTGSGRTDAGVHAAGQVCHFDAETNIPAERFSLCFDRLLPPDVRVLASAAAEAGFDCSRRAKRKTYVYFAYHAPCELPLYSRYGAFLKAACNADRMRSAARLLVGEHDFAAFRALGSSAKTTVRTVYSVGVEEVPLCGGRGYRVAVCGNGFLYNMVRVIAGELFAVGMGLRGEEDILRAFATGKRECLAGTMPAKGLTLLAVEYGAPLFQNAN